MERISEIECFFVFVFNYEFCFECVVFECDGFCYFEIFILYCFGVIIWCEFYRYRRFVVIRRVYERLVDVAREFVYLNCFWVELWLVVW